MLLKNFQTHLDDHHNNNLDGLPRQLKKNNHRGILQTLVGNELYTIP